jgi:hypothetical protein
LLLNILSSKMNTRNNGIEFFVPQTSNRYDHITVAKQAGARLLDV